MSSFQFGASFDLRLYPSLYYLDLSLNKLETFKASYLQNNLILCFLNISFNKIKTIDGKMFKDKIPDGELDVTSNILTNITGKESRYLYAANNQIQSLKLDERSYVLNLRKNFLNQIPSNIEHVYSLDMSLNNVSIITVSTFIKMVKLVVLYVSSNFIEKIESDSFLNQNNLETLDLSNNLVRNLENDALCGLFNLKYLSLKQNYIQSIHKSLFRQLNNLLELYLGGNQIKFVEDDSFTKLNYLKFLELESFNSLSGSENKNRSLNTTNSTFVGLKNVRFVSLNKLTFDSMVNLVNINENLKPIYDSQVLNREYYKSRHVVFSQNNYTTWDCFVILYSIKRQVQVNLYLDRQFNQFVNYCGQFSLSHLSSIINSFYN
jgi:Leucine-rich repeat (LRR) protein